MSIKNEEKKNHTPISELGEFGLIKKITQNLTPINKSTIKSVGDDAAVIKNGSKYTLISKDLLVEGVHFDLSYVPLTHLGYKSIAVNISDICAMNGVPKQVLIGIAISNRFTVEAVQDLYKGIEFACKKYNVDLIGGDTTSSQTGLTISVTIVGEAKKESITYRSGAKANDLLVVTGDLGAAYLGFQLLKREKNMFLENPTIQPELKGHDYVLQRQLKPEPPVKFNKILNELDILPTSMIDISDGLSSEILHLSEESKVGFSIYEEKIPVDYRVMNFATELHLNPIFCALNGGEDYELLFTMKQEDYDKIKKDPDFTIIGHATHKSEGVNFIDKQSVSHQLTAQGWDFVKKQ